MANKTDRGLSVHLNSSNLKRRTKCMLSETLTRPIRTYGSGCWTLREKDGNMLGIFKRRILRMIYGPINDSVIRRTRYSSEL